MAAGSASWCTNIGNERSEVLVTVLTESEGLEGLHPMAMGVMEKFGNIVLAIHISLSFAQIPEGPAGSPEAAVHRLRLLQQQWSLSVCTAVRRMGSPAGEQKLS